MERETLELDVVFVGAGPANLSGALHLSRLVKQYNETVKNGERQGEPLGDIEIGVIEKGATVGAHILSGAVMDPRALKELIPEFPGAEVLYDENDYVVGVRTGDKGIYKEGKREPNCEPGFDLIARVTVL